MVILINNVKETGFKRLRKFLHIHKGSDENAMKCNNNKNDVLEHPALIVLRCLVSNKSFIIYKRVVIGACLTSR